MRRFELRGFRKSLSITALSCALLLAALDGAQAGATSGEDPPAWLDAYREPASRLIGAALADDAAWQRLAELGDTFGPRLSGSAGLQAAIGWAVDQMTRDGLEQVRAEPVKVPHWVRGTESLVILDPVERPLVMLGLGGSIGTPPEGIVAEPLVVRSFDDLEARSAEARGRIVVYNVPYTTYGQTVQYRTNGAVRAARHGAVASLVRSVGPIGLRTPHTGAMRYDDEQPRIPAAAIPVEDAEQLQRIQDRGERYRLRLKMEAHMLPDADSANVVAELRGRERPEEVMVIACHLDSWDVGTGSSDDGGGCIAVWEALRLMTRLDLRPRRTVRAVLFTNEENGLRGAYAYRDRYRDQLASHVAMLESDSGVFRPLGFGFTGSDGARTTVRHIASLLSGIGAARIGPTGGGADIGPSVQAGNIPALSLDVEGSQYFLVHHTPADTIDRIDPVDLARAVAAVAVMSYVIADHPQRLGEEAPPATR
jgi:carboxypeptidase Q